MVLMAACDSYYKFIYVDIGAAGSCHDSTIFKESNYGMELLNGKLPIPEPEPLPGTNVPFPHFFAADAAFPLHQNIMRPFPGAFLNERKNIFNMRLSRVRRTIENTFGILAQRWRRLRNPILASEDLCQDIIMATVVLHNYIQKGEQDIPIEKRRYCPTGFTDWYDNNGVMHPGHWREVGHGLRTVGKLGSNNASRRVQSLREHLADWLLSPFGALSHQLNQLYQYGVPDHFRE